MNSSEKTKLLIDRLRANHNDHDLYREMKKVVRDNVSLWHLKYDKESKVLSTVAEDESYFYEIQLEFQLLLPYYSKSVTIYEREEDYREDAFSYTFGWSFTGSYESFKRFRINMKNNTSAVLYRNSILKGSANEY